MPVFPPQYGIPSPPRIFDTVSMGFIATIPQQTFTGFPYQQHEPSLLPAQQASPPTTNTTNTTSTRHPRRAGLPHSNFPPPLLRASSSSASSMSSTSSAGSGGRHRSSGGTMGRTTRTAGGRHPHRHHMITQGQFRDHQHSSPHPDQFIITNMGQIEIPPPIPPRPSQSPSTNQPLASPPYQPSQHRPTTPPIANRPTVPPTHPTSSPQQPSIHPHFRSKLVCKLHCKHCTSLMCTRGMKAILLGNTKVELYSTDTPPVGVQLVWQDYVTQNCL